MEDSQIKKALQEKLLVFEAKASDFRRAIKALEGKSPEGKSPERTSGTPSRKRRWLGRQVLRHRKVCKNPECPKKGGRFLGESRQKFCSTECRRSYFNRLRGEKRKKKPEADRVQKKKELLARLKEETGSPGGNSGEKSQGPAKHDRGVTIIRTTPTPAADHS